MLLLLNKKIFLLYIIALAFTTSIFAQTKKSYNLAGTMKEKNAGIMFYHLKIEDDGKGNIQGTGITKNFKGDEVICKVIGTINYYTKKLAFHETEVIEPKNTKLEEVCFMGGIFDYIITKKTTEVKGNFIGQNFKKERCGYGKIAMIASTKFNVLDTTSTIAKSEKPSVIKTEKNEPVAANVPTVNDTKTITEIKNDKNHFYYYNNANITIDISDFDKIDGDMVSLYLNDKLLLENYELTKDKKQLNLALSNNTDKPDIITLVAINEGYYDTNSALLEITDGRDTKQYKAVNTKGKKITIVLNKHK
jgi:hypothetical protein